MDVACLRPSSEARAASGGVRAPNTSFSNQQSLKLFGLLKKLHRVRGYSHTFGALDPVQASFVVRICQWMAVFVDRLVDK